MENVFEFDLTELNNLSNVGLTASASAPEILVQNFIHFLQKNFKVLVHEPEYIQENVSFKNSSTAKGCKEIMAVYSPISKEELSSFLTQYNIGALQQFKGILEGIENTNYKIKTSQNFLFLLFLKKE